MGFVGFYEGPYWGVLEMQSRLIAQKLVGEDLPDHFGQVEQIQKDLRDAMRKRENNIPQFWMGDYVGLVDEIARNLNIERTDQPFDGQKGPTLPSRYCGAGTDTDEAAKVVQEVRVLLHDAQSKSRFVPAAAFRAMQGGWKLERKIDSRNKSSPGGTLKGTAHFHPRFPTDPKYTAEYLYIEEGTFTMDTGLSFPATRRYVYRYDETNDDISAWFVEGDQVTVERLFNRLHFEPPNDKSKGWLAKGSHWCDPDQYESSCEFRFRGASLPMFGITHTSRGPNKDYTMESWYTKPTGP
ncbi:hypothetical protein EJ04DRAFT_507872 [Polyplosphaeria fusca]|uniref:DUF6314 domain-containing protein n=1 Tax=Polyplosphaeria fusca TaxID=682080 RepID=A0A9P4RBN9_9PLEO|nr:hypothetical protein EJ04DRAFT_507872 [Polyplosphaeria fusca]